MYKKKMKAGLIKRRGGQVAAVLENILDSKGKLTPEDVVNEAKDENSPIHSRFEWDDAKGGHKYRLMQARLLITTVKVGYIGGEKQKGFYNVHVETGERAYFPRQTVLNDKAMQREVLSYAAKQLKHWTDEYSEISQFDGIVNKQKLEKLIDEL